MASSAGGRGSIQSACLFPASEVYLQPKKQAKHSGPNKGREVVLCQTVRPSVKYHPCEAQLAVINHYQHEPCRLQQHPRTMRQPPLCPNEDSACPCPKGLPAATATPSLYHYSYLCISLSLLVSLLLWPTFSAFGFSPFTSSSETLLLQGVADIS